VMIFNTVVALRFASSKTRNAMQQQSRSGSFLPLVPVNANVLRLPADGDDVNLAVAVEVGRGQVLDVHTALVDQGPLPLCSLRARRSVDAHAAPLARLHAQVVAHADNQLVVAVTVEVGAPDGMAPLQLVIDDLALPQLALFIRRRVDHDLM